MNKHKVIRAVERAVQRSKGDLVVHPAPIYLEALAVEMAERARYNIAMCVARELATSHDEAEACFIRDLILNTPINEALRLIPDKARRPAHRTAGRGAPSTRRKAEPRRKR